MIDVHLVDDRHIELIKYQALCKMPGKIGMALDNRDRARPPAFVTGVKTIGTTDCKSWNHLHVERRSMIVVNENDDVGLCFVLEPVPGPIVACKSWLPIVLIRLALIDSSTQRRNVT